MHECEFQMLPMQSLHVHVQLGNKFNDENVCTISIHAVTMHAEATSVTSAVCHADYRQYYAIQVSSNKCLRETAYFTLVQLQLDYASTIWSPWLNKDKV